MPCGPHHLETSFPCEGEYKIRPYEMDWIVWPISSFADSQNFTSRTRNTVQHDVLEYASTTVFLATKLMEATAILRR
jgi:hypothetical protein